MLMNEYSKKINPMILGKITNSREVWMGRGCKSLKGVKDNNNTTLYAFYDLEKSPCSFDILLFLTLAENYRVKHTACDSVHIVIVPGSNHGYRSRVSEEDININYLNWMKIHVLSETCWLLPSVTAVSCLETRKEAELLYNYSNNTYPNKQDYSIEFPIERMNYSHIINEIVSSENFIKPIKANEQAIAQVSNWVNYVGKGKKIVTLLLRESLSETARNSSLQTWGALYALIQNDEIQPVIVRDAERSLDPIPQELTNAIIFPEANHVDLRMALFELSHLNMFIMNGTSALTWFNPNINYLLFRPLSKIPEYTSGSLEFYINQGLIVGKQPPFAGPHQKWIWNYEDDLSTLISCYQDMLDFLKSKGR